MPRSKNQWKRDDGFRVSDLRTYVLKFSKRAFKATKVYSSIQFGFNYHDSDFLKDHNSKL